MSGVTLIHSEDSGEPKCSVVFGGGRLRNDDLVDDRRIEIAFQSAYYARAGWHDDDEGIEAIGYKIIGVEQFGGASHEYKSWAARRWRHMGFCPDSGFYVATQSDWLSAVKARWQHIPLRHYVVDGRDGYVEVLAQRFAWREWLWTAGPRDALANTDHAETGEGVE